MKTWVKLKKYFQGGSNITYKWVEPTQIDTQAHQDELMEEWGEHSDGGHNYGYNIEMTVLKEDEFPPKEWLEKEMKRVSDDIVRSEAHIERQTNLLMEYSVMLENKYKTMSIAELKEKATKVGIHVNYIIPTKKYYFLYLPPHTVCDFDDKTEYDSEEEALIAGLEYVKTHGKK